MLGKPPISSLFAARLITSILGSNVIFYALPPTRTPGWCRNPNQKGEGYDYP